jgi:hypothetical protein
MSGRVSQEIDVEMDMSEPAYRRAAPVDIDLNQYSSSAAGNTPAYATSIDSTPDYDAVEVSPEFNGAPMSQTSGRTRVSPRVEY